MKDISRRDWIRLASVAGLGSAASCAFGATSVGGLGAEMDGTPSARPFAHSVFEYGAAGDGKTDDTAAFQKTLDSVHAAGGGIAYVPAGQYLISGSLNIPQGTTLDGVSRGPTSHANFGQFNVPIPPLSVTGSMLLATGGKGNEDATPLLTLNANSAVVGLSIFYPDQVWESTPAEYPWAIHMQGNNCTVENVELVNPWRGIKAVQAHRHFISKVTGQPLRTGIFVDETEDIGRIENVHFYPWWKNTAHLRNFTYHNGESFIFGRSDWEYVFNTFSIGYRIAYKFIQGRTGCCNGNFIGIGADTARHACVVEKAQDPGLLITNGEFVSDVPRFGGDGPYEFDPPDSGPMQVLVMKPTGNDPQKQGPVRFVNCSFWGPTRQIARLESDSTLGFGHCTFCQWDKTLAAISAEAGNLLVDGCEFRQEGQQLHLGSEVRQAVVIGNMARSKWNISNEALHGDIQIGFNTSSA